MHRSKDGFAHGRDAGSGNAKRHERGRQKGPPAWRAKIAIMRVVSESRCNESGSGPDLDTIDLAVLVRPHARR